MKKAKFVRDIPIIKNHHTKRRIGTLLIEGKYEQTLIKQMIKNRGLSFEGIIINGEILFLCPTKKGHR